jgi:long-chain fatty acid transport protein
MRPARLALLLVLASSPALGNPVDNFGLGSRSTAMGGAVAADARDFSANYYNPSGLALARHTDLSLGYMTVIQKLEMNGDGSQVDPVRALVGGIVAPGAIWTIPFAFGLAVHLPDHRLSRARSMRAEEPRWIFWDNRPQLIYLSANLAVRPFDWLAIGGGVAFLAATRGAFEVSGTAVLPVGSRTEYDSQLRHEVDADLTSVRYPTFGVTVEPDDRLAFGLVYREEAEIGLAIDAELTGDVDATLLQVPARYELESRTANAFIPRQLVLGGRLRMTDELTLSADVTWVNWAAYEAPVSRSRSELDVEAPPDLNLELPPNPKPTTRVDPGFENRLVPRLGAEYLHQVHRRAFLPLRAGYVFERSPVPPQTGRTSFVDTDRHVLSAGAGFLWREPGEVVTGSLRFDLHVMWAILPVRVTHKDSPADYVGDFRASGNQFGVGATFSLGLF